jgi:hypothetical protein
MLDEAVPGMLRLLMEVSNRSSLSCGSGSSIDCEWVGKLFDLGAKPIIVRTIRAQRMRRKQQLGEAVVGMCWRHVDWC